MLTNRMKALSLFVVNGRGQLDRWRERKNMAEQINALLVHAQDETFYDLARALKSLGMKVMYAQNCREASQVLKKQGSIDLVFAGTNLRDGGWADVLALAQQSKSYLPVIVVSRMVDVGLYLDSIGRGAFDYVTPPFLTSDLAHIVRSAIYKELVSVKQELTAPPVA
jgi:DNA-binding NtrC family response regulator